MKSAENLIWFCRWRYKNVDKIWRSAQLLTKTAIYVCNTFA